MECGNHFMGDNARYQHMKSVHDIYRCLLCLDNDLIQGADKYHDHLKREHNGRDGKHAVCFDCGAHFEQRTYLRHAT